MRTPVAEGLVFPESPRWHRGELWMSDMYGGRVVRIDQSGRLAVVAEFADRPSGLGFLPDGTPLVVLMDSRTLVRIESGSAVLHADLTHVPAEMLNDMVVDSAGRAYVDCIGSHDDHGRPRPGSDSILVIDTDGAVRVATTDVVRPNGIALSADERTLIVTDGSALTAFEVQNDGALTSGRRFADIAGDGICLDEEGAVWVGTLTAQKFVRVREGGEIVETIDSGSRWASACVTGDDDRRTLYLCTCETTMDIMMNQAGMGARGFVESVRVTVAGAGTP